MKNILKQNINEGYFLFVSEWWGLSDNPGSIGFFVYPNGEYIKKKIFHRHIENNIEESGVFDEAKLSSLTKFINENIKESSSRMIYDYGCNIEIKKDGNEIKVINDRDLFAKIIMLIPFR